MKKCISCKEEKSLLLCKSCNLGLGNFRDRIDLLDEAKNYLNNVNR